MSAAALTDILVRADRFHRAGRLSEAESLFRQALEIDGSRTDVLLRLGILAYQAGHPSAAAEIISDVVDKHPEWPDAHANLGLILKAMGRLEEAATALERAIELAPSLPEPHANLGGLLHDLGQLEEAEKAYRRAISLKPDFAEAHSNLGNLLSDLNRFQEAISHYREALHTDPENPQILANLGAALLELGSVSEAAPVLEQAVAIRPTLVAALCNLGACYRELGDTDKAAQTFRRALEVDENSLSALTLLASLLEVASRLEEAYEIALRACRVDPRNPAGNLIAARCERRMGLVDNALKRLEATPFEDATIKVRCAASKELGSLYHRNERYADAFVCFEQSSEWTAAAWRAMGIDGAGYQAELDAMSDILVAPGTGKWPPAAYSGPAPIFLVGFPRSGTTLLDQILDCHSRLSTLEEKPLIETAAAGLSNHAAGYPGCLPNLTDGDLEPLRALYWSSVAHFAPELDDGCLLVDKLPLNIARAPLIYRMFPNAKFILALRHPCDCILSAFMQSFAPNKSMASLLTLESAAQTYAKIMNLWSASRAAFSLDAVEVRYEDLVGDFENTAHRLVDGLGLSWEDGLLGFAEHARARRIATPSYHQVVEPINTRAVGRWEHYRDKFEPLRQTLEPICNDLGYTF